MHMGLTGFSTGLFAVFVVGIILVVRDPVQQLSERVRILEAQVGSKPSSTSQVPAI